MPNLDIWQWLLVGFVAFLIGLSKTGVTGIGVVALAMFALMRRTFSLAPSISELLGSLYCQRLASIGFFFGDNANRSKLVERTTWAIRSSR